MNIDEIKSLTELMVANDLTEIMIRDGDNRVVIRRNKPFSAAEVVAHVPAITHAMAAAPMMMPQAAPAAAAPAAPAAPAAAEGVFVKSPMVGTFYPAPDPDSPPFVSVGTKVGPDTVVCIIEAMKVFNEIKAEAAGTIEAVLVSNGQPVEFGQPLFRLSR